ncbi:MAG: methylamine utilization protein [Janthinobacterium lividum]
MTFSSRLARRITPPVILSLLMSMPLSGALAASVSVQLNDANGKPVADGAVYAEPLSGQALPRQLKRSTVEQKSRKFMPLMTVIQTGTEIDFPNNDTVRHQVYSFSPPKIFELKLYSGTPGTPILFDKPGSVVLGCNIHDQMVAYIHIVNTPYFAKTDASGRARLENLVAGKYMLKAWHYNQSPGGAPADKELTLAATDVSAMLALTIKPGSVAN